MKVKDELGIFWNCDGQSEASGIELFGLFNHPETNVAIDPHKFGWMSPDFDCHASYIRTAKYVVHSVAVRVNKWPDDKTWHDHVESTLRALVGRGAVVSWAGGYDSNWSPDVLNPADSAGNIYAAYSTTTGFLCNAGLSEEIRFLDNEQLTILWNLIAGA